MKKVALIVAGGSGVRMGTDLPKQFLEISGKPLLMHTLDVFRKYDPSMLIMLVLPEEHRSYWEMLCRKCHFTVPHQVVHGGEKRYHSVKNGLEVIREEGIVYIHDGVRPLVSLQTLQRCYEEAVLHGNAVPVIPVSESVRWKDEKGSHPVDRSRLVLIQTPQTFLISEIQQAYRQAFRPDFTDDATVMESLGKTIHLVEGNRENIKITWPEDLFFADAILNKRF